MPIFAHGYRPYEGQYRNRLQTVGAIAGESLQLCWRSKLMRRLVFVAWAPFLYMGLVFFLLGQLTTSENVDAMAGSMAATVVQGMLFNVVGPEFIENFLKNPGSLRGDLWQTLFDIFLSRTVIWPAFVASIIAAGQLMSKDLRGRTYSLYMSRPMGKLDYLCGKVLGAWLPIAMLTVLPAYGLYLLSLLFSPDLYLAVQTWRVPAGITLYAVTVLPCFILIMMALSTLTTSDKAVAFMWVGLCVVTKIASSIFKSFQPDALWPHYVSIFDLYKRGCQWAFGLPPLEHLDKANPAMTNLYTMMNFPGEHSTTLMLYGCFAAVALVFILRKLSALERE